MSLTLKGQSGVYEIVNSVNGKKYVGIANDLINRFSVHRVRLRKGVSHNRFLRNSWNKHGEGAFVFKALIVCSREDAVMYESKLIESGDYVYNAAITPAAGRPKGSKTSEEGRRNMSVCRLGKKPSEETRRKLSEARRLWWTKTGADSVEIDRHLNRENKTTRKVVRTELSPKRVLVFSEK